MNKYYSILGVGLLSSVALTSCNQDMIDGMENDNPYYEIHDYTVNAIVSGEKDASSRANIDGDGKSFLWNKGDKITIWNGTKGYTFNIALQYDENKFASANVPFYYDGEESPWEGAASVWGIYPEVTGDGNVTAEGNVFTFKLSDQIALSDEENDSKPHLQNMMYMLGNGEVTGSDANNITFEHLTSMFMFKLNNFRDEQITLKSLEIKADADVFSKTLTVTDGVKAYSEPTSTITVKFGDNGYQMEEGQRIERFINVFPTTAMTAQTKLTFTVTYTHGTESTELPQVLKEGTVGDLFNGQPLVTEDNCQFVAGKRYIINLRPELPEDERGYTETEPGKFSISKGEGLHNFVKYEESSLTDANTTITLADNIDMENVEYASISSFAGTFDGNGKTISNLAVPMFKENTGTIKNMKLDGTNITAQLNSSIDIENVTAALATINKGTIEEVSVKATINASGNSASGSVGGLVAINEGTITGCSVLDGSAINNKENSKMNIGGLVCKNTGTITGSSVESSVTINHNGASSITIGGLVSIFEGGNITGSSAAADIKINNTSDFFIGGLVGDAYAGELHITGCYSAGTIKKTVGGTGTVKIGGLISRGTWEWGVCQLNITGCYTTTDIKDSGDNITGFAIANGFIGSYNLVKDGSELNTQECYWFNLAENDTQLSTDGNQKYDIPEVNKTQSVDDIKTYMSAMNSVITETGFEYVPGDGKAPLKIQSAEPGFGGPDFGEGDELK